MLINSTRNAKEYIEKNLEKYLNNIIYNRKMERTFGYSYFA